MAELFEIDFNCHKTNSSYFSDLDISRTHLVCTLFANAIAHMRGGTAAYTGTKDPHFGLALGAVSCHFRKEVAPYQGYDMWSKVLSWDEKWIYIVTHFVRKNANKPSSYVLYPQATKSQLRTRKGVLSGSRDHSSGTPAHSTPEKDIFATALSKCVFKSGRKTISPDTMLQLSGLIPESADQGGELAGIENRRLEGMKLASILAIQNQKALEAEFVGSGESVLGLHTDGAGILGVVSTLLQLAGLKRSQFL